jgi:hypothetical protein
MGKSKYRTVVAAVLVGAVLFSPLLCGMSCLETNGIRPSAAVESASRAEELAAEFVGSALVGCVLSHVISRIDFSGWTDQVDVGTWVWIGVEALRMSDEAWRGEVLWR